MNLSYALGPSTFLYHADMRDALKALPADSIDSVLCDPPYHLLSTVKRFANTPRTESAMPKAGPYERTSRGFLGQKWDGGDIAFQPDTWREVLRVLKPGGYLAAFGAPKNFGRLQVAILDAGFEDRDCILYMVDPNDPICQFLESLNNSQVDAFMRCLAESELSGFLAWIFGTGFNKKGYIRDAAGAIVREGWAGALKPAFEPIVIARKPLSEGTVALNMARWGTGAINADGCRIPGSKPDTTRGAGGQNGVYSPIGAQGRIEDDGRGRWPANVALDSSAAVLEAFPIAPGQLARARADGTPQNNKIYGVLKHGTSAPTPRGDSGSAARYFYHAKANKVDRAGSKHPTIKPISLLRHIARLITPPGGVVLDPFAGSGTTGAACALEGFSCVMVEREAEYVADICRRFA